MILSKRLQAVADLLTKTEIIPCVADVGTDHGYIPIYMVEQGVCKDAIAMDIRKGPLERAVEHIREHHLEEYIETRLSDGLAALKENEAQAIVIAGMGGATMQGILEAEKHAINHETVLVLQPQSEVEEFRYYLKGQGYELLAEDMVYEDGKFYPMMKVCKRAVGRVANHECSQSETEQGRFQIDAEQVHLQETGWEQPGDTAEYRKLCMMYGPMLLSRKHPVLQEFLHWQHGQKQKILENLKQNAATESGSRRVAEIEAELAKIEQALLEYKEV